MVNRPTPAQLRDFLQYESESGTLRWRRRGRGMFKTQKMADAWNNRFAGKEAFTARHSYGYRQGMILNRLYTAHRVIWAMHYGEWPSGAIDHINGDPADNRIRNLRAVSRTENQRNRRVPSNNTSGFIGVSRVKGTMKWEAFIGIDGRSKKLGVFAVKGDAVRARQMAERELGYHENHGRNN